MAVKPMIAMLNVMPLWLDRTADREAELMQARLAPDMHPLPFQIQTASDTAKGVVARLTGTDAPAMPDTETTFAELKARCAKTVAYLESCDPAAVDAGAEKEIVITFPNGAGVRFDGTTYVTGFAMPNFYFHVTTAYAILRNAGGELGKRDYLAALAPYMFGPPSS